MNTTHGALLLSVLTLAACVPDAAPDGGSDPTTGATVPVVDGRYDQNLAGCSDPNSLTRLTVRGDGFTFYESDCIFGRKGGQPGAAEGTLICMGEGQRFTRNIRLEAETDSLRIIEGGAARDYARC